MTLRKFIHTMQNMCEPAYIALKGTMALCCGMLFCSLIILIHIEPMDCSSYNLYLCAKELSTVPAGLMLVASIASVCFEEQSTYQ